MAMSEEERKEYEAELEYQYQKENAEIEEQYEKRIGGRYGDYNELHELEYSYRASQPTVEKSPLVLHDLVQEREYHEEQEEEREYRGFIEEGYAQSEKQRRTRMSDSITGDEEYHGFLESGYEQAEKRREKGIAGQREKAQLQMESSARTAAKIEGKLREVHGKAKSFFDKITSPNITTDNKGRKKYVGGVLGPSFGSPLTGRRGIPRSTKKGSARGGVTGIESGFSPKFPTMLGSTATGGSGGMTTTSFPKFFVGTPRDVTPAAKLPRGQKKKKHFAKSAKKLKESTRFEPKKMGIEVNFKKQGPFGAKRTNPLNGKKKKFRLGF